MSRARSQRIGNYEVLDVIGYGGMGVVYKAVDRGIGRLVAIKMITRGFEENPELLRRFYREAQSAGMLQHPNIVAVYELGKHEENPYLVMEYVEGETLAQLISKKAEYSLIEKLGMIISSCNALQYAHEHGVVHRDVKPANIMVLKNNGLKLLDFGIARLANETITQAGQVIGTIAYMSPEQLTGDLVDLRSDVFSMSVVGFELLTFEHPFGAREAHSAITKILNEPPQAIEALLPDCPPELGAALARGMAKSREERYPSASDLAFELTRVVESLKRAQVSEYVERARTLITKGEYYRAKDVLKEVIIIDPQNTTAITLTSQVQDALQKEHRTREIQLLRSRAEEAAAQKNYDDALNCLDRVISIDTTNLDLPKLREKWAREKEIHEAATQGMVEKAVRLAREAMDQGDIDAAKAILMACRTETGDRTELRQLVKEIEKQRTLLAEAAVERAIRDIETLAVGKQYGAIREVLLQVAKHVPSAPPALQERLEKVKNEIGSDMPTVIMPSSGGEGGDQTVVSVSAPEESTAVAASRAPDTSGTAAAKAGAETETRLAAKTHFPGLMLAVVAVVAIVVTAGVYYFVARSQKTTPGVTAIANTPTAISAVPWCTVVELVDAKGKKIAVGQPTPVVVSVPPGEYTIHLTGPSGEEKSDHLTVTRAPANYRVTFNSVDVEKLISAY